jgi:hypothetical protein
MTHSTHAAPQSRRSLRASNRGIALIMVILFTAFLSALGLGLILAVFMDRLAAGNMNGSVALLYAADAGIELAARDLGTTEDWDEVLSGSRRSSFTDGAAGGVRSLPGGGAVDLTALTNWLNCGKSSNCTAAQMDANSRERPWGINNPRWQLFAHGLIGHLAPLLRPEPCYLAVWIADDGREEDGDPLSDAASGESGHGIVRVHAETFSFGGLSRAIEAELGRACLGEGAGSCLPGIRVQSWQELRQFVP